MPVAAVMRRDRFLIAACIALITILAWAYLIHLSRLMSAENQNETMMAAMGMTMDAGWKLADVLFTFAMWAVMMVGMMAPTALPMLLFFAAAQVSRGRKGTSLSTFAFGLGYLAVWTGFSLGAALAQSGLHQAAMLTPAMTSARSRLTGAILIAAGAYQLTTWKNKCLARCRSPLGFLMTKWRDGAIGAFQMGSEHGMYCLGCCWALMCVLFAVGVMNLVWVAALTVFVLFEKVGPAGALVGRLAGAAMVLFGIVQIV